MGKGFAIEVRDDYIYVLHQPNFEMTRDTMVEIWAELAAVCKETDCNRVLVEAPAPARRMDTTAAFESGTRVSQIAPGLKIAMHFTDYTTDELTEFFKTVARNRGTRVEFFADKESALEWLGVGQANTMP